MRFLKTVMIGLAALYLAAMAVIWQQQRSLMYVPSSAQATPEAAGFTGAQSLFLTTSDTQRILAWFGPPAAGQPLILYFRGNSGSLAEEARRLNLLRADGAGILAIDYRGYGGSSGSPTEAGLLLDAEAAFAKASALGFSAENIVVYGQSLGSGVAVAMAARHKVAALVLEAPYSSTVDVAQARYWMFPVKWLMIDQFRSDLRIGRVNAPILILHGDADETIPIRFGQRLFALAHEPKTFIKLAGAGHLLLLRAGVAAQVRAWIASTLTRK